MTRQIRKSGLGLLILVALAFGPRCAYADPVTISPGKIEGVVGKDVKGGVSCMTFRLNYDPDVLTFKSIKKGAVLPNASIDKNLDEKADPGKIGLGVLCSSTSEDEKKFASITEDGVVMRVVFVVNEKAKIGKSPLTLDIIRIMDSNNEQPAPLGFTSEAGELNVIAAPAAGAPKTSLAEIPNLWIYIGIGIGVFVLLLLVIAVMSRRREPERPAPTFAPPAGTVVPRFTPEGANFSHTCVKCGGVIQLPGAMRGQTFQCGACGTTQVAGTSSP